MIPANAGMSRSVALAYCVCVYVCVAVRTCVCVCVELTCCRLKRPLMTQSSKGALTRARAPD